MNEKDFVNLCKKAVAEYSNEHLDKSDGKKITEDDVFIVWMCKTLQNSKALASTTLFDGMYYELTFKPGFVPCGAGCTLYKEHAEFADVEPAAQGVARAGVYPYLSPVVGLDPYSPCSKPHICIAFQPVTKPRDLL